MITLLHGPGRNAWSVSALAATIAMVMLAGCGGGEGSSASVTPRTSVAAWQKSAGALNSARALRVTSTTGCQIQVSSPQHTLGIIDVIGPQGATVDVLFLDSEDLRAGTTLTFAFDQQQPLDCLRTVRAGGVEVNPGFGLVWREGLVATTVTVSLPADLLGTTNVSEEGSWWTGGGYAFDGSRVAHLRGATPGATYQLTVLEGNIGTTEPSNNTSNPFWFTGSQGVETLVTASMLDGTDFISPMSPVGLTLVQNGSSGDGPSLLPLEVGLGPQTLSLSALGDDVRGAVAVSARMPDAEKQASAASIPAADRSEAVRLAYLAALGARAGLVTGQGDNAGQGLVTTACPAGGTAVREDVQADTSIVQTLDIAAWDGTSQWPDATSWMMTEANLNAIPSGAFATSRQVFSHCQGLAVQASQPLLASSALPASTTWNLDGTVTRSMSPMTQWQQQMTSNGGPLIDVASLTVMGRVEWDSLAISTRGSGDNPPEGVSDQQAVLSGQALFSGLRTLDSPLNAGPNAASDFGLGGALALQPGLQVTDLKSSATATIASGNLLVSTGWSTSAITDRVTLDRMAFVYNGRTYQAEGVIYSGRGSIYWKPHWVDLTVTSDGMLVGNAVGMPTDAKVMIDVDGASQAL